MGLLVQVELTHRSGLPEDAVINTFHFNTPAGPVAADMDAIEVALDAFYNASPGAGLPIPAALLSTALSRTTGVDKIRFYDSTGHLDGTPMGSPLRISNFQLAGASAGAFDLPSEVAIVVSIHGNLMGLPEESGAGVVRPRARRRGRLYFGPINSAATEMVATTHRTKVADTARNALSAAADNLMGNALTVWSIWSRAGASVTPVTGGFVDDAFDTQERRGEAAVARTVFGTGA